MAYMNLLYFVYLLFHVFGPSGVTLTFSFAIVEPISLSMHSTGLQETSGHGFYDFAERPFLN